MFDQSSLPVVWVQSTELEQARANLNTGKGQGINNSFKMLPGIDSAAAL